MIRLLKLIKWDIQTKMGRFFWMFFFVRNLPGEFGIELRRLLLRSYFQRAGSNLVVMEGVYIRNIDKLALGDNVSIGTNSFIQAAGGVCIENDVILGPSTKIWSANHLYNDPGKPIREQGYELKKVTIGNNVWVGANVFIMPGAQIGDGVVISAGSVVGGKAYPPYVILAGNPARKIGERNPPR